MGQIDHASPSSGRTTDDVDKIRIEPETDIWITTVLPAVVIAVILVLAACIACILYKVQFVPSIYVMRPLDK